MNLSEASNLPTNRSFGSLFTAVFTGVGIYGYFQAWAQTLWMACLAIAILFALVSLLAHRWLTPLNKAWFVLGQLMGAIVSPIVLGIIFFLLLTPVALITRLFGRDELLLKRSSAESYWIDRTPSGPEPDSFKNQF